MTTDHPQHPPAQLEPIYVASRASIPERGIMWRQLRSEGVKITSTWIDEDGEGETGSFVDLWDRIHKEIAAASALVLYAERDDFPLKGALIEAGIALGMGKPVIVCLPDLGLLPRNYRPIGSWVSHPLVSRRDDIQAAVRLATSSRTNAQRSFSLDGTFETAVDKYHGELWIDKDGYANFKWHIEGGDFGSAREALVAFINCLQQRLAKEADCPYHSRAPIAAPVNDGDRTRCALCGHKKRHFLHDDDQAPNYHSFVALPAAALSAAEEIPQTTYKNKRQLSSDERFKLNAALNTYTFNNCDHEHDGYPNHLICRWCSLEVIAAIVSRHFATTPPAPSVDMPPDNAAAIALLDEWLSRPIVEDDGGSSDRMRRSIDGNRLSDRKFWSELVSSPDARAIEQVIAFWAMSLPGEVAKALELRHVRELKEQVMRAITTHAHEQYADALEQAAQVCEGLVTFTEDHQCQCEHCAWCTALETAATAIRTLTNQPTQPGEK